MVCVCLSLVLTGVRSWGCALSVGLLVQVMDRNKIKAASIERELTVLEHLGASPYVVQYKAAYITQAEVSFVLELYVGLAVMAV